MNRITVVSTQYYGAGHPHRTGLEHAQACRDRPRRFPGETLAGRTLPTSPLKGLWTHQTGGFYHDGRFATLLDVISQYNDFGRLSLTDREKHDLVEYLKSLRKKAKSRQA